MNIIIRHRKLEQAYLDMVRDFNEAPNGSPLEARIEGEMAGFDRALRLAHIDISPAYIDADMITMEKYGEVPMCCGKLFDKQPQPA